MKNSTTIVASPIAVLVALLCAGGSVFAATPDGTYVGTTDQGKAFELGVAAGQVDQWLIYFEVSCEYGSASGGVRTTMSPPCAIEANGSFVCGSTVCPSWGVGSEVEGLFFPDDTVTGTIEVAARMSQGCCYQVIAFEATLFVKDVFADGFESGDCTEWSMQVPGVC